LIQIKTSAGEAPITDAGRDILPCRRNNMTRSVAKIVLAGAAGLVVLFASDNLSPTNSGSLVTQAEARVGRPLTPMSAAGVARRTTRRAYVGAAAVGAAAVGAAAVTPRCYMTQNGQVCR
jgi:hypothetical protein